MVNASVNASVNVSVNASANTSVNASVNTSVNATVNTSVNPSLVNICVCNEATSLLTMSSSVTAQSLSLSLSVDSSAVAMVISLLPSHWFLEIVDNILDRCRVGVVNLQNRTWYYRDIIFMVL